jgi:hypothetical protein
MLFLFDHEVCSSFYSNNGQKKTIMKESDTVTREDTDEDQRRPRRRDCFKTFTGKSYITRDMLGFHHSIHHSSSSIIHLLITLVSLSGFKDEDQKFIILQFLLQQ